MPKINKISDPNRDDFWLKELQKSLNKSSVRSVEKQDSNSLYQQINDIMNGSKSKYPSVKAAVDEMMERSGMKSYLIKVQQEKVSSDFQDNNGSKKTAQDQSTTQENALNLVEKSARKDLMKKIEEAFEHKDWKQAGKLNAELDLLDGHQLVNAAESIRVLKYCKFKVSGKECPNPVPFDLQAWEQYTLGYNDGAHSSPEELEKDLAFTRAVFQNVSNRMNKKANAVPVVIQKCPAIQNTLENYIKDSRGNLPIPAIINKLQSIHKNDVSDAKDWDEENLIKLVSKLNLEAKSNNPNSLDNYSNLGRRDVSSDSEIDASNNDGFAGLMPTKL